jgi:predicted acyl esterase
LDGNLAQSYQDWLLRWFDRWLKGARNRVEDDPPIRIFVMGGGSGRKNADGRLDHGGRWRSECEWPLKRTRFTRYYMHSDGTLGPKSPREYEPPSRYRYDPDDPVPTVSGNISALYDILPMPEGVSGEAPLWTRMRSLVTQGATHQAESPGTFGSKPPYLALSCRADVLSFYTPPLAHDTEVTGPIQVKLWASSSAIDTDFTAKLLDIYPESADYPEGYDMNICEGIVRARYRDFSGKAKLLEPDAIYEFTIILEPTSNLFKAGHRIRLDISSSNFPRFDVNPNTGEATGRHTRTEVAENVVFHDAVHPSFIVLPIIP